MLVCCVEGGICVVTPCILHSVCGKEKIKDKLSVCIICQSENYKTSYNYNNERQYRIIYSRCN